MHTDWQTFVTLAIGLIALVYLVRRWWPGARNLFGHRQGEHATDCATMKAQDGAGSCGTGCGACGQGTTPAKDHRIRIVRRAKP